MFDGHLASCVGENIDGIQSQICIAQITKNDYCT